MVTFESKLKRAKLYHMGIRGGISRTSLADANQSRDWKIYAKFARKLIHVARILHADDALSGLKIGDPVYALDSTTIDLCLQNPGHLSKKSYALEQESYDT